MTEKDEKDTSQDNSPEMGDDLDNLSLDEKAAFEKIMAEISEMNQGPSTSSDGEDKPDADSSSAEPAAGEKKQSSDDSESTKGQDLSDDQQAALDKIMAEINAGESGQDPDPEPAQDKEPTAEGDDEKLSDDQQAALDKIMAEINARESGQETETQSGENAPPTAEQAEIEEKPKNESEKLSLDEFNDELTNLLTTADQLPKEESETAAASHDIKIAPKPETVKPAPDPEPELPPIKYGPALQPSQAESDAGAPSADVQTGPSEPDQEDYVVLHEIDAAQIGKAHLNNRASRRGTWAERLGLVIKIAAAALTVAAIAGATYWGYDLFRQKRHIAHGLTDQPTPEQSSPGSGRTKITADPGSLAIAVRAATENPDRVPQQLSATTFASLKSDLMAARQQINRKIQEIVDLKAHYQKGIQEEQLKIRAELQIKPARSLESAQADSRIDLSMRAIQRRMVYIAKLDTPLKRLEASSEDLLYMERRTQLFETLSQWISGPSIPEYKQEVGNRIGTHMKVTTELNVDDIQMDPPSMASIWSDVQAGMNKGKSNVAARSKNDAENQHIGAEICNGEYDRKYLLTSLSGETAQCLTQWSGKDLYLNGLTELSPQAAKILVQWPGEWLSLNGIKEISVETAKYLSQWPGKRLSLNGLAKLSPQATAQLSRWQGEQLEMIGLTAIGRWENYATRLYLSETLRRKLQM